MYAGTGLVGACPYGLLSVLLALALTRFLRTTTAESCLGQGAHAGRGQRSQAGALPRYEDCVSVPSCARMGDGLVAQWHIQRTYSSTHTNVVRTGMGTFGWTEAKRREPLPFVMRGPFGPAQVRVL